MTDDAPTLAEHRNNLLLAATQATAGTFALLEHHRDLAEATELTRFADDVPELLAEALGLALDFELAGIDRFIAAADYDPIGLREQREALNQLRGAVTRFNEGWAG